jgi:DNA-binding beta-propeller fold protein YncE
MTPVVHERGLSRRRRLALLLAVTAVALTLAPIGVRAARGQTVPTLPNGPALPSVDIPALPGSADLSGLFSLFPASPDLKQFDLTKASQVKEALEALPVNVFRPTFNITDEPGSWFDTGVNISGGKALAPVELIPGVPAKAKFVIGPDTGAASGHTVTWLIRPEGSVPFDQPSAFVGTKEYDIKEPGLYAFTCKIHPYMLGAIVADDPMTAGLDFGKKSVVNMYNGSVVVPTYSDLIFQLVNTFFKATVPSNWQKFQANQESTWDPQFPKAPILTHKQDGTASVLPTLDGFFHQYFGYPKTLAAGNQKPSTPGIGEAWIDTQFEKTAGKSKPGTATAIDVENWTVSKKVGLPEVNMNNPHNMWTDKDQKLIYQTEWFSDKLDVFDRETLAFVRQITVGNEPSHVMTRTDTDQLHVALNGANSVVELSPGAKGIDRQLVTSRSGEPVAHPHAHWMSSDGKRMVTPNPNSDDASLFDVPSGKIIQKAKLARIPIASSMSSDNKKYYIANLLANNISCVSMDINVPSCSDKGQPAIRKTIRLDSNWNLIDKPTGPVGLLPIQIPVAPDNSVMLAAATMSGQIAVINPKTDNVVKYLPCDAGCHGINYGAKEGGGYYAYVSSKFANRMIVIDGDPNGDGNPEDARIAGSLVLDGVASTRTDDTISAYPGQGGQGVLAIPLVYNGWVQNLPANWKSQLTCKQREPMSTTAC